MSNRRQKRNKIEKELKRVKESLSLSTHELVLLSNSIFKKWKKEEDYHDYILDYMFTIAYNHYKRYGDYIPVNKMLFLLNKFKGINTDKPGLKIYYSNITKKINRRVASKLYRERQKKQKNLEKFLEKLLSYNEEGSISKTAADKLCVFFTGFSLEGIINNGVDYSLVDAIDDILHEAKHTFIDKLPSINLLLISSLSFEVKISDLELDTFFKSVEGPILV